MSFQDPQHPFEAPSTSNSPKTIQLQGANIVFIFTGKAQLRAIALMDQVPKLSGTQCLGIRDARLASYSHSRVPAAPLASTKKQHGHPPQSPLISILPASITSQSVFTKPGPWVLQATP